jgi:hypothetical protein
MPSSAQVAQHRLPNAHPPHQRNPLRHSPCEALTQRTSKPQSTPSHPAPIPLPASPLPSIPPHPAPADHMVPSEPPTPLVPLAPPSPPAAQRSTATNGCTTAPAPSSNKAAASSTKCQWIRRHKWNWDFLTGCRVGIDGRGRGLGVRGWS